LGLIQYQKHQQKFELNNVSANYRARTQKEFLEKIFDFSLYYLTYDVNYVSYENGAIWNKAKNDYIYSYHIGSQIIITDFMKGKLREGNCEISYTLCIKEEFINEFLKTFFSIANSNITTSFKAEWFEAFLKPSLLPDNIVKNLLKKLNNKGIFCTIVKETEIILDIITEPIWLTDEDKDILLSVKL
jgi:hypothetical protein